MQSKTINSVRSFNEEKAMRWADQKPMTETWIFSKPRIMQSFFKEVNV
jgi:hypothetical protein